MYTWTDWLQQNALLHLDVQDTLVLGSECCSPAHVPAAAESSIKAASVLETGTAPTGGKLPKIIYRIATMAFDN